MVSRPKISRRGFLIGLGGLVVISGGVFLFRKEAPTSPRLVSRGLKFLDEQMPFDVCIIGSGPAGAVLGQRLVERGLRTVILESGYDLFRPPLGSNIGGLDVYRSSGTIAYPIAATRIRALGGTSNVWTGRCSRLHPLDFEENAYTPVDAPWPITYADIEPYYQRAEETLRVRGGTLSEYHPPRSRDLPLPADLDISGLKGMMRGVGVTVDDSPTSTSRYQKGPIRAAAELLPHFAESEKSALIAGATVTRLISDSSGRIEGAEVKSPGGTVKTIRASTFVVACGAIEAARLLLLSKSKTYPEGVGNAHGRVGRSFMEHPNIRFSGMVSHTWNTLSPAYEIGRSHQFYDAFKRKGYGSVLLVASQSWIFRDDLKKWSPETIKEKVGAILGRMRKGELRIGATVEMKPSDENRVYLSSDLHDSFGNPAAELSMRYSQEDLNTFEQARMLIRKIYGDLDAEALSESGISWSHHHMGTCRMGENPRTSVVNRDLRVHNTENLYVAGSAVFVTGGASHPTLAITALSHRLADHLLNKLKGSFREKTEALEVRTG